MTLTIEIPKDLAARAQAADVTEDKLQPAILAAISDVIADAERVPESESAATSLRGFINRFSAPVPADGKPWSEREGFGPC